MTQEELKFKIIIDDHEFIITKNKVNRISYPVLSNQYNYYIKDSIGVIIKIWEFGSNLYIDIPKSHNNLVSVVYGDDIISLNEFLLLFKSLGVSNNNRVIAEISEHINLIINDIGKDKFRYNFQLISGDYHYELVE